MTFSDVPLGILAEHGGRVKEAARGQVAWERGRLRPEGLGACAPHVRRAVSGSSHSPSAGRLPSTGVPPWAPSFWMHGIERQAFPEKTTPIENLPCHPPKSSRNQEWQTSIPPEPGFLQPEVFRLQPPTFPFPPHLSGLLQILFRLQHPKLFFQPGAPGLPPIQSAGKPKAFPLQPGTPSLEPNPFRLEPDDFPFPPGSLWLEPDPRFASSSAIATVPCAVV